MYYDEDENVKSTTLYKILNGDDGQIRENAPVDNAVSTLANHIPFAESTRRRLQFRHREPTPPPNMPHHLSPCF
ncbi:hypothetical protein IEQ34_021139 [Dendrobium chrysotoxum]|uniref:Uncharacterized protein n=1 Tax=Dendrobium chrysotoxum TaxID=161865 RepID=A0AAV7G2P6_DENCH|nr:hypothetical protein IEQ34_021139 [Dendrobium chrysotoxum]